MYKVTSKKLEPNENSEKIQENEKISRDITPVVPEPDTECSDESNSETEKPETSRTEEAETEAAPEEAPAVPTPEEIEQMMAEAEQRGYLRGRNEQIEQLMEAPTGYETETLGEGGHLQGEPMILGNLKPSIWDL